MSSEEENALLPLSSPLKEPYAWLEAYCKQDSDSSKKLIQIWEEEIQIGYYPSKRGGEGIFLDDIIRKKLVLYDYQNISTTPQWWLLLYCLSCRNLQYPDKIDETLTLKYPILSRFICWGADYKKYIADKRVRITKSDNSKTQKNLCFKIKKFGITEEFSLHKISLSTYNLFNFFSAKGEKNKKGKSRDDRGDASHLCHNSECWRPTHLVLESHIVNMQRTSCPGWVYILHTNTLINACKCPNIGCMRIHVVEEDRLIKIDTLINEGGGESSTSSNKGKRKKM
jgi:hypothetical protein